MDAGDIKSDLQALQRLYGLLDKDGDGGLNVASHILDEHARLILKNLLDAATQRVLKAYTELIAARLDVPSAAYLKPPQSNDSSKEQPISQQNLALTSAVGETFRAEQGSDQKRKLDQPIRNVVASVPEYRKKRCRICQKSTLKQQLEFIESNLDERVPGPSIVISNTTHNNNNEKGRQTGPPISSNIRDFGNIDFSSATVVNCGNETTDNESQEADCLSKEASEAVIEIESCISALQLGADHLYLFGESYAQSRNFVQPPNNVLHPCQFTRNRPPALEGTASDELRESIKPVGKVIQDRGPKVKAIIDKIESGKWRTSHGDFKPSQVPNFQNVCSFQVKKETSDTAPSWPVNFASPDKKSLGRPIKKKRNVHAMFPPDRPSNNSAKMITDGNKKHPPNVKGMITVLNKNRTSLQQQESESTVSTSYSSEWSSQQNSTSDGDSEEYSFPGRTHRSHYVTPSTASESGASSPSLSSDIPSQYSTSTSQGEDDDDDGAYSSTGSEEEDRSSKSEGNSSYNQSIQSRSKKLGPSRIHRPANGINRKKQSGTWKRLKDRLAIIFHHHHHHHHHHNNDVNHHDKRKSFLPQRETEAYGEKAVEKMRKTVIRGKKQQNHFHGLMEAVLSHVRRSKKPKSVGKKVPLAKGEHENKKAVKKSQWLKLLQHHRGAKAHVKLGIGKKKPYSKALPKIK